MAAKLEDPIDGRSAPAPTRAVAHRGRFGDPRPPGVAELALPPAAMPSRRGLRPLKAWRYVGVFGPEVMICLAAVRLGPARQWFWAVWDRERGRLDEHTVRRPGEVELSFGRAAIRTPGLTVELALAETDGVETVSPSGDAYAWTRKQGGIEATGSLTVADLSGAGELRFAAEAERRRHENLLLVRSRYRQPFGTFSGALPGGSRLASGWGVMEDHDVNW
jgi:hypothetical protein